MLGLRLGLLDLALLNWLGLTEGVCQLGIVDHQIVLLVGLRVIDHLDFGLRLGRVEVASCIGHSEAASHLRLLGAGIELRVWIADWLEVFLLGGLVAGGDAPNLKALHSFSSFSGDEL